jgi:hypothetical protein
MMLLLRNCVAIVIRRAINNIKTVLSGLAAAVAQTKAKPGQVRPNGNFAFLIERKGIAEKNKNLRAEMRGAPREDVS